MNFMIVHGKFVCGSFLISVCMFIVSKAFLIWSATVIVRAGGGVICLNPFATVLFNEWSALTVEYCVLYPCFHKCVWYVWYVCTEFTRCRISFILPYQISKPCLNINIL